MRITLGLRFCAVATLVLGTGVDAQRSTPQPPNRSSGTVSPPTTPAPALGCQPSIADLKKIASDEWAASQDANRVLAAVDKKIGPGAADTWMFMDTSDNGLLFAVAFPPRLYRFNLSEALRKREPIATATAPSVVVIDVNTSRIDAPIIEKVIVERNGKVVPPLSNSLAPHTMVTRLGAKVVLNNGRLTYLCSAFFPSAQVTITGIPSAGANMVRTLNDDQLEALSGREFPKPVQAAGLVGLSESRVRKLLGETSSQSLGQIGYDVQGGERLYLTIKEGKVQAVSNEKVLIANLKPPTKNPNPETVEPSSDTPAGAVVKCGDGHYMLRNEDLTCFGRSGVAQRYSTPTPTPGADMVVKCGKSISSNEWNKMSAGEQAAFCGSPSPSAGTVACGRPSTIGTLDWNRMSAEQQRAVCVPVKPVAPEKTEQPCPRPPTVGSLDWGRMSDEAKLAACRAAQKPPAPHQ
jgi:hypothetical protein